MKKRFILSILTALALLVLIFPAAPISAAPVGQTPLAAADIPQFVDPLPILDITGAPNGTIQTIVAGKSRIELDMKEFRANMLPSTDTFMPNYEGTWVWGYVNPNDPKLDLSQPRDTYTGPVIIATRDVPTEIKFVNELGSTDTTNVLAYNNATDQSLHWANPNEVDRYVQGPDESLPWVGNPDHYSGAIPAAVHLHGGEIPAAIDGGPESWFTSAGQHGPTFYSKDGNTDGNYCIYRYPNVQEAAPLWFHDHTLGATRLNVYMGLAGAYMLTDPKQKLPEGLSATGLQRWVLTKDKAAIVDQILAELLQVPGFPRTERFLNMVKIKLSEVLDCTDTADLAQQIKTTLMQIPGCPRNPAFWSSVMARIPDLKGLIKQVDEPLIPLVIQDRMFDTNGQLYFPAGGDDPVNPSPNPQHQYWVPEFFGESPNVHDTICVNGKTWPYLDVKAQRYRFQMINGSNARSYLLSFDDSSANANSVHPTIWQISTDQGYLDKPVAVNPLRIMPGERAGFIIDFSNVPSGTNLILNNFGPDVPLSTLPVPPGDVSDPATTGTVMQFRVIDGAPAKDTSFNPAASGATIRKGGAAIVRLVNPATGTLAKGVKPALTRELTLNEIANDNPTTYNGIDYSGGPLEILVNNTKWMGTRPDVMDPNMDPNMMGSPIPGFMPDGTGNYLSELPKEGTTEIWEIVNMSMDAHPIHTHLAQFQLMNRQTFDMGQYMMNAYEPAFPGGMFMPEYGPPLAYGPSAASGGKYGGNPDVAPFLMGNPQPPDPNEAGWKDTIMAPPGFVTRFVVRWGPTDMPATVNPNAVRYPFLPNDIIPGTKCAIFDYVWHCHIVDHEDNEMMRPDAVIPAFNAHRKYIIGRDY